MTLAAVAGGRAERPGPDLVLEYLADPGARQVGPDLDVLGRLDPAQALLDERAEVIGRDVLPGMVRDYSQTGRGALRTPGRA
jgi:hypothetical protein